MEELISALLITISCFLTWAGIIRFLYLIPFKLQITFLRNETETDLQISVYWGLVGIRVNPQLQERSMEVMISKVSLFSHPLDLETDTRTDESGREEQKPGDIIRNVSLFIPFIRKLLSDCIKLGRADHFQGHLIFGTGDVVTTGNIYGYYQAFLFLIPQWWRVSLIPDFTRLTFQGRVEGGLLIDTPGYILIRAIRNLFPIIMKWKNDP